MSPPLVIPASGVSPRAGTQGPGGVVELVALGPGYFADAKFRDDSGSQNSG
jgi:hypothetical protein